MGFRTGVFPPVDPEAFLTLSFRARMRILAVHWVDHGFGTPRQVHAVYAAKVAGLYVLCGSVLITVTSGIGPVWEVARWWDQPIFYQKAILWTVLLEIIGMAGAWGTLNARFAPKTGGISYWVRRDTIRLAPWPGKVPFTGGDRRTRFDIALYLAILANLVLALARVPHFVGTHIAEIGR